MNTKVFTTMGVSEHVREKDDFYATPPYAVQQLLDREIFSNIVWEPCIGMGHIAEVLKQNGYTIISSDIIDRQYPNTNIYNFTEDNQNPIFTYNIDQTLNPVLIQDYIRNIRYYPDIITNPPYKCATEFVAKALQICPQHTKIAMFLKIQFLESKSRFETIFKNNPPAKIYVFVNRVNCWENGIEPSTSSAICYAWYIWIKGYIGPTIIDWII